MNTILHLIIAALLLTYVSGVPSETLETPCPHKPTPKPTKTTTPSPCADKKFKSTKEPMYTGARSYPGNIHRLPENKQVIDGHNNSHTNINAPSPSPTPSRLPGPEPGSSISLENTNASATGSNTLSLGAETDSAALSGNTESGENTIFGHVQPGGATGFLGAFNGLFAGSPSPSI